MGTFGTYKKNMLYTTLKTPEQQKGRKTNFRPEAERAKGRIAE